MSSFKDYYIVPSTLSSIRHRSECIPYYDAFYSDEQGGWCLGGSSLPIFVAPMACIIDDNNWRKFDSEGLNVIIPRTVDFKKRLHLAKNQLLWIAVGLEEFEQIIKETDEIEDQLFICLDIANGHMRYALDLCKKGKDKFGDKLVLMFGNIANPDTYFDYSNAGIDYCRVSIGNGQACLTNTLTGISQDIPEMLSKLKEHKNYLTNYNPYGNKIPKIVVDGGISSIRDIIVALAMGADYVMCGKIFAQCEEACGEIVEKYMSYTKDVVCETCSPKKITPTEFTDWVPGRMYYGMSTERAQKEMGNKKIKPAEGKEYWIPIEYKLSDWISQFVAAISSTMSYCNVTQLDDFIKKATVCKYK